MLTDSELKESIQFSDFNYTSIGIQLLPNIMNFEQDEELYEHDCHLIQNLTSSFQYKFKVDAFGSLQTFGGDTNITMKTLYEGLYYKNFWGNEN